MNPDAISRQLLCVICGGVLENPVQTPCEHLIWCVQGGICPVAGALIHACAVCSESELLEWCVRELKCPMDNLPLDALKVERPRLVCMWKAVVECIPSNDRPAASAV